MLVDPGNIRILDKFVGTINIHLKPCHQIAKSGLEHVRDRIRIIIAQDLKPDFAVTLLHGRQTFRQIRG